MRTQLFDLNTALTKTQKQSLQDQITLKELSTLNSKYTEELIHLRTTSEKTQTRLTTAVNERDELKRNLAKLEGRVYSYKITLADVEHRFRTQKVKQEALQESHRATMEGVAEVYLKLRTSMDNYGEILEEYNKKVSGNNTISSAVKKIENMNTVHVDWRNSQLADARKHGIYIEAEDFGSIKEEMMIILTQ